MTIIELIVCLVAALFMTRTILSFGKKANTMMEKLKRKCDEEVSRADEDFTNIVD